MYHLDGVGSLEYGVAGDEDIDAGVFEDAAGLEVDAAVALYHGVGAAVGDHLAEAADLVGHGWDELLRAEARIDCHDESQVDVADDLFEDGEGGAWIDGYAGQHACFVYLLYGAVQVRAALLVHGHDAGAEFGQGVAPLLGMYDHQVYVEGELDFALDGGHHGEAKRDVGHETAVHHVEVEVVCLTAV